MATGKRRKLGLADLDTIAPAVGSYVGPMPPDGLYRVRITRMKVTETSGGDARIAASMVVAHDAGAPKARYNGAFADWSSQITPQGKPHIKAFADAFGFTSQEMDNPLIGDDDEQIIKLGKKDVGGQTARVGLKKRSYTKNDGSRGFSMEVKSCAPDTGELEGDEAGEPEIDDDDLDVDDEYDAEDTDDTYTGDDDDDEAEESADDEDDYDDSEDEAGEESDDEDDDEAEEEPAPRARKAVKAPPAKAPAKKAPAKAAGRTARKPF